MAWARFITKPGLVGVGSGMTYLFQQVYQYKQFEEQMNPLSDAKELLTREQVQANQKEYVVIGRQSPDVGPWDPKKYPKHHYLDAINKSPLFLKQLGTRMDNEKHYDMPVGGDFITVPLTPNPNVPQVVIKPENMISTAVEDLPDDALYEVSFARKQAFTDLSKGKSPFYHSSFAFRVVTPERPAHPNTVVISGKQVKEMVADINKTICEPQHCTMNSSNCYSAGLYGMKALAAVVDMSSVDETTKKTNLKSIADVTRQVARDNYGRGVTNNPVVSVALTSDMYKLLKKHELLIDSEVQHQNKV